MNSNELKELTFENATVTDDAKTFWLYQKEIDKFNVVRFAVILAKKSGMHLRIAKIPPDVFMGTFIGSDEIVLNREYTNLIKEYAEIFPELVETGLKYAIRHEYWHAATPDIRERFFRMKKIERNEETGIAILERQARKKLMKEIIAVYRDKSIKNDGVFFTEGIRIIARGMVFAHCMVGRKTLEYWEENFNEYLCFKSVDILYSFLPDEFCGLIKENMEYVLDELRRRIDEKHLQVPFLIEKLKKGHWWEKENAARKLGEKGDQSAIPHLIKTLRDRDYRVRFTAAVSLAKLGVKRGLPMLIKSLEKKSREIKAEAVSALGEISDKSILSALKNLLKDKNKNIRRKAREAIAKILRKRDDCLERNAKVYEK